MKNIKVLGSGCSKCVKTAELIEKLAAELGVEAAVEKESDVQVIMGYGVMRTPAVVVDEQLVHSGSIPTQADITTWLQS
ncbi:thioredoxin family protein [Amphritea atlantica]|uniref:Thioredoxin family protein n=1 Tax=Amphritea atlantica TaxID=355243 RepID=A0ABY5GRZ8_9GAMM|nr:thioredoxin family protein [Amphritea atlantica]